MQGMTLPRPGSPREEWTDGESLAVELLNLASWLTQRTIYEADRNLRKGVALDETHFLSQVPTGKVLIDRLARDSRKFNVRALFASQLAGDLLRVSGFASLVNAVFVGRTDDDEAQGEALRLLRVPTGVGYEQMLGTLSPRPAARRPARRHPAPVHLRRRARRRGEDPHRPGGAAPRARPGRARHQPGRQPGLGAGRCRSAAARAGGRSGLPDDGRTDAGSARRAHSARERLGRDRRERPLVAAVGSADDAPLLDDEELDLLDGPATTTHDDDRAIRRWTRRGDDERSRTANRRPTTPGATRVACAGETVR